jgi:hypothetical protein
MLRRALFVFVAVGGVLVGCDQKKPGQDGDKKSEVDDYKQASINAEAKARLKSIGRAMSASYEEERVDSTGKVTHALCESAKSVPASIADVTDRKYQSAPIDWQESGWRCLHFTVDEPQYFQYDVVSDPAKGTFTAHARRVAKSKEITFSLSGKIDPDQGLIVDRQVSEAN